MSESIRIVREIDGATIEISIDVESTVIPDRLPTAVDEAFGATRAWLQAAITYDQAAR